MLEILVSDAGHPTAKLDGRYLHSPRDPVREAENIVRPVVQREPPCVVMLGFGLGYATERILAGTQTTQVIVFEPDPKLTVELCAARDVSEMVSSPRIRWCETGEALDRALAVDAAAGFEVLSLSARRLAQPEQFSVADSVLAAFRSRVEINGNTVARFGRLWVRNLCRNVDAIATGTPVTRFGNLFRGLPGLLLAAGPTLEQILPYLPELGSRAVVVAVDTAVAVCEAHGVQPDIAVVVDPQYWNARHLDRVQPSSTLLVAESSTHPSVFSRFRSPPVFCSSLFPLGREIEAAFGSMGSLGAGGSVSTTAWDLLRFSGCSAIYTAGLDLGFPDGRTHFRDSFFEALAVAVATRFSPAEKTLFRYISSAAPHPVPANDGGTVLTDKRMELYRNWFAREVTKEDAPPTFSLTSGGVRIDGVELADRAQLLSRPPCRDEIQGKIDLIRPLTPREMGRRRAAIADRLEVLVGELTQLREVARRATIIVSEIERELDADRPVDFSRLETLDASIASLGGRAVVSFLMQQAIGRIRSGFGSASVAEQVEASRQLYGELLDSVEFHIPFLVAAIGDASESVTGRGD